MKRLVVYGSAFGNTQQIAETISVAIDGQLKMVSGLTLSDIDDLELLVVGSPTQGGNALPEVQKFVKQLPKLAGVKAAAFDTRFDINQQKFGLRMLMKTIGYAAPKIASQLKSRGAVLVAKPEGFIVGDKEGPLKDGELKRAAEWGQSLLR